ncbi:MAG: hypothetical protein ACR2GP_11090 [Burkholderiaceae bacterium]
MLQWKIPASRAAAFFFALSQLVVSQSGAAENPDADTCVTSTSRPQLAEEDLPPAERGAPSIKQQQKIADPEREFALQMLERAERELRLAEAHTAIAADAQIREIVNDTAASRRKEISRLRAWLAKRNALSTPRMLNPQENR